MTVVHVAVAVIRGDDDRVLIARRPDHVHKGGLWEFPGGKVESGEAVLQALAREVAEELAIDVVAAEPLTEIRHEYPEKTVLLDVWLVSDYKGCPRGNEGQPLCWVAPGQLRDYDFPEANQAIIDALIARKLSAQ